MGLLQREESGELLVDRVLNKPVMDGATKEFVAVTSS
jgi:hypothetical protein